MKDVSVAEVESSCEMCFTGYDPIYLSCLSCCDSSSTIKSRCEMGREEKKQQTHLRVKRLFVSWCSVLKQAKKSRLMLPVSLQFYIKLYVVKILSKTADGLPHWFRYGSGKKTAVIKPKADSIRGTCPI